MPRLHGYRDRIQRDTHIHFEHVPPYSVIIDRDIRLARDGVRKPIDLGAGDYSIVVVDVRASRPDVTLSFSVGDKTDVLTVTGPWLVGQHGESLLLEMLAIVGDARQEGRTADAMAVLTEMLERRRSATTVLRPIIIPIRQHWAVTAYTNEGAQPGPLDVWVRALLTRDVA